jgi:hypothetical protein
MLLSVCAVVLGAPASAGAATVFHVKSTIDAPQASPGPDCASTEDVCTLRSSIQAANSVDSGPVTIDVPAGHYRLTIAPSGGDDAATGDLNVTNDGFPVSIVGAGSGKTVVDANYLDRAFNIGSGANVLISKMTIEHGRPGGLGKTTGCPATEPTTDANGGGVLSDGTLRISNDVLTDNVASGAGGGIESIAGSSDTLTMSGTKLDGNFACPQSAVIGFRDGGGIDVSGGTDTHIRQSTITGNSSPDNGGGVDEESISDPITITDSTISHNTAANSGGGIEAGGGGTFLLFGDTLTGNQAGNNGGGLDNGGGDTDTYVNTTITHNTAGGEGGGIESGATFDGETFGDGEFISFSTITENTATQGGGNIGVSEVGGAVIDNSIIAMGHPDNCPGFGVTDNGHNLFDDTTDSGAECGAGPSTHDVVTGHPDLGPLQDNGGPTKTEALLSGSPAIDAASTANCTSETKNSSGKQVDQREFVPRPQGSRCDIGAFEGTPNLGITASPEKSSIFVGQQDTVTEVVSNSGPTDATDSTFTDPGANYRIDSVSTSQGNCTHTSTTASCNLNTIASGGKVTITIILTGLSKGTIRLRSATATSGLDRDQRNNAASVGITVKSKKKPPPPPPPPPPAKPSITIAHLGPACHPPKSTINITAMAKAAAGIRSAVISVTGHGFSNRSGFSPPSGKTVKKQALHDSIPGSKLHPSATYRVTAKVVDSMGRSAEAHTSFMICKPPPKRGFTG